MVQPAGNSNQQGNFVQPASVARFFLGSQGQAGRFDGTQRHIRQAPYGVAAYQGKAPGLQFAVIGRGHGRLKNLVQLVLGRAGGLPNRSEESRGGKEWGSKVKTR